MAEVEGIFRVAWIVLENFGPPCCQTAFDRLIHCNKSNDSRGDHKAHRVTSQLFPLCPHGSDDIHEQKMAPWVYLDSEKSAPNVWSSAVYVIIGSTGWESEVLCWSCGRH
jgi:hypothetical protein